MSTHIDVMEKIEQDRIVREIYVENESMKKGIEQGIKRGIEQGIEKGIERGIEKGIEKGIKETAIRMLKANLQLEQISEFTNLSLEEISELASELEN